MHFLYKLTFLSGKSYIGQTTRKMITRITQHRQSARNGSQLAVHCAWRVYGEPDVCVLGEFESDAALHAAEIEAIATNETMAPKGYNLCRGGETAPSKNPLVAAKISAAAKGRKYADITPFSNASKTQWENPEYRSKVSAGLKAAWTEEKRKARGEKMRAMWEARKADGWVMPESQREKLRTKVVSDATRSKMSAAAKGKPKAPRSKETCLKLSASTAQSWENKDHAEARKKAISSALLLRHKNMSEEDKLNFKEIRKRAWATRLANRINQHS